VVWRWLVLVLCVCLSCCTTWQSSYVGLGLLFTVLHSLVLRCFLLTFYRHCYQLILSLFLLLLQSTAEFDIVPLSMRSVFLWFLANVNSRSLYAIARPSVCLSSVCNARAPYSGGWNFRQYFYGIRYLGHPLTSTENFTEIVPGEPLRRRS